MPHVLLDANVLVPVRLCDLMLHLAEAHLIRPLWTDAILVEVERALLRLATNAPGEQSSRLAQGARKRIGAMKAAFPDAFITDWPLRMNGISLPDPDDHHVLAAALAGNADRLVTINLRDLPEESIPRGLMIQHPDALLLELWHSDRDDMWECLHRLVSGKTRPPITIEQVLMTLERTGLSNFAAAVRKQL